MTVKDIVKSVSSMLGREDVFNYLLDSNCEVGEDTIPTVTALTSLSNLVIGELAGTFIPMVKSERVSTFGGKVTFASLSERCYKVRRVLSTDNVELNYSKTPEYIISPYNEIIVEYEYAPPKYQLESEIGYTEKDVTLTALSYGVIAEYLLTKGCFEEAVMWHQRYADSIAEQRKIKNCTIKGRSFV